MNLRCFFQFTFLSNNTPRNFMDSSLFILWLLIVKFGNCRGTLSFLLGLWKKEYFVFSTFSKSLLATSHSFIPVVPCLHQKTDRIYFMGVKKICIVCKHYWIKETWSIIEIIDIKKEVRGVLILILEELHTSQVSNWFLLWGLIQYTVFCLKESFLSTCDSYLLYHIIRAFLGVLFDLLY